MNILLHIWVALIVAGSAVHDFHLSKTDVRYSTKDRALQVTLHTFIDDTQLALEARDSLEYKLMENAEHILADSILGAYFKDNFLIKVDGTPIEFEYLGKEASEDIEGLYAYLEVPNLALPSEIEITNKILMEQFDDQKNIIKVMLDNDNKAFHLLSVDDYTKTIQF